MAGRPKGSKNKHSFQVEELAKKFDQEPFEILMMIASGDWKGLGFDSPNKTCFTAAGIEYEEPWILVKDRGAAAKEACKYLYSQKQAIQHSTGPEGIKVVVEDYSSRAPLTIKEEG